MPRKKTPRNYKEEYRKYHGSPEAIRQRSNRNKARRKLGLKKGDKREVDHKRSIKNGGTNARSNLRAISRKANRRKGAR